MTIEEIEFWSLLVVIAQWIFNLLVGYAVYRSQSWKSEMASLKRNASEHANQLSAELHDATQKLVDERFRTVTHQVANHAQATVTAMEEIKARLQDGEQNGRQMTERDHKIELMIAAMRDNLKDYMRDNMAGKDDLKRHEAATQGRFENLGRQIVVVSERLARVEGVR